MSEIASAYVSLLPSMKGFGSGVQRQAGSEVGRAGGFLGGLLGKGMLAGFAAVGVAAGVGKALYSIGSTFDSLSDTIRISTGKSGDALAALDGIAQDVGKHVPVAFDQIGPVVADLNRRLGLTGKPLQHLSEQFLNLQHLTGEVIDTQSITGALNTFDVKSGQTGKVMDELFRVTQSTGVGFNDLAGQLASSGPILSQFGFSIQESASLIGSLDKAGIDSSRTIAAMRTGLANFAKAGKDPQKALGDTVTQIEGFIKSGDKAGALNLASSIFGTRGAAQFVAAVKSGRVNIDDLTAATKGNKDTINKAAKDTADFSERWQMFKNRVMLKLEPIANRVFDAISNGSKRLTPAIQTISIAFRTQVVPAVRQAATVFQEKVLPVIKQVADFFATRFGPVLSQYIGIIRTQVIPILTELGKWFATKILPVILDVYKSVAKDLAPTFTQLAETFRTQVLPAVSQLLKWFEKARPTIQRVVEVLAKVIAFNVKLTAAILGKVLPVLIRFAGFLITQVVANIKRTIAVIGAIIGIVKKFGGALVDAVQSAVKFAEGVIDKAKKVISFFKNLPDKLKQAFGNARQLLVDIGKHIIEGLINGIKAMAKKAADAAIAVVKGALDKAKKFLHIKSPSKLTYDIGVNIGEGLARGIESTAGRVASATEKLGKKVKGQVAKLRDQLASVRSDFASLVEPIASNFTQGLFDFTDATSFTANLSSVKATLTTLIGNFKTLIGEGLKPAFLYALFQEGGPALINSLAGLSATDAQAAGSLFGDVQSLSDQLGTAVAGSTDKGAALENQTVRLERKLDHLIDATKKVGDDVGRQVNGAASSGKKKAA